MAAPTVGSLQAKMDILNEPMSTIATAQDLQNERLTDTEQQIADLRSATDECTAAIDAKVIDHDARLVTALGQIDLLKEELEKRANAQAERADREIWLFDDKEKKPSTFKSDRKCVQDVAEVRQGLPKRQVLGREEGVDMV